MPTGIYDRSKSKLNLGEFGKRAPWNKGKTGIYSTLTLKRLSDACKKLNPAWKGGRYKKDGYVFVYVPDHPNAAANGYVREHRLVVEKQIGRHLTRKEQVHHLGERDENDPYMLMAFACDGPHRRFEHGLSVKREEIVFDGRKLKCA